MVVILVHGMLRTPLSMLCLGRRLKRAGFNPHYFAYSVTLESWLGCLNRFKAFVSQHSQSDYIIVGHSLGTVLTRAALPDLQHQPKACLFLTPPTQACVLARLFKPRWWYRLLTGDMGQRLADPNFMATLPLPTIPTKIYSGTHGIQQHWFPLAGEANDGILRVSETLLPGIEQQSVFASHTLIMNQQLIADDIVAFTSKLKPHS